MKYAVCSLLVVFGLSASPAAAQSQSDRDAIMAALEHWNRGFELGDGDLAARDYAEDAEFTNAPGAHATGPKEIARVLAAGFSRGTAHRIEYDFNDLRFLSDTVALLRSRTFQDGSDRMTGVNQLRVFVKRGGRWVIVSHLLSAERAPAPR